jgi:hypothetical protein
MNNEPPRIPSAGPSPLPPQLPARKKGFPKWVLLVVVLVVGFFGFLGFRVVQFARHVREHPRQAVPGEAEFREANRQIIASKGTAAFGNNREAVALAQEYSRRLKALREEFFTKGKEDAFSLSKGDFLTYCQWNGDSCVFLVHVPELRRFEGDAKKSLTDLAWMSAHVVLKEKARPPPKTVAVGVKGAILYDAILIGDFLPGAAPDGEGVKQRGSGITDVNLFYPFFAPKEQPAQAEPK